MKDWQLSAVAVLLVVVAVLASFAFLQSRPGAGVASGTLEYQGKTYYFEETASIPCDGAPGSSTPPQEAEFQGGTYRWTIESCFSPGGLALNGTITASNGTSESFRLSSRLFRDADGWITWFVFGGQMGVRWDGAYKVMVLSEKQG